MLELFIFAEQQLTVYSFVVKRHVWCHHNCTVAKTCAHRPYMVTRAIAETTDRSSQGWKFFCPSATVADGFQNLPAT